MSQSRPSEIKALSGARAIPPLILVLFHFCEGHGYRGIDQPICHAGFWNAFITCAKWFDLPVSKGYLWVEFFFALSGFILVHVYGARARDFWKGRAYFPFLKARLARLYPVHVATLLSMLVLMWGLNQLSYIGGYLSIYHQPWGPINTWPSFVLNLLLVQGWNTLPVLTWNGASWFVSVEFLLCLLFPVYLLLSRGRWWVGVAMIGAGVSALMVLALTGGHGLDITYHNGMFRGMAGFAVGVGLAMLFERAQNAGMGRLPGWVFSILQLGALAYFFWATYQTGWSHTPRDLWFVTSLYGLIFVLAFDKGFLARLFSSKTMLALGTWSYGVYMGQTFWLQLIRYFEQRWYPAPDTMIAGARFSDVMWWLEPALLTGICILWGWLLTKWIEHPVAKLLRPKPKAA